MMRTKCTLDILYLGIETSVEIHDEMFIKCNYYSTRRDAILGQSCILERFLLVPQYPRQLVKFFGSELGPGARFALSTAPRLRQYHQVCWRTTRSVLSRGPPYIMYYREKTQYCNVYSRVVCLLQHGIFGVRELYRDRAYCDQGQDDATTVIVTFASFSIFQNPLVPPSVILIQQ